MKRRRGHLRKRVPRTGEEPPSPMLREAEADKLGNAEKHQRSDARSDTRVSHYRRKLRTKAGEVALREHRIRIRADDAAERILKEIRPSSGDWTTEKEGVKT